jgi:hypothetical protein
MTPTEGFLRHGNDSYIANFAETEREVLVNLVQQIIEILAERHDHANEDPLAAMVGITTHDSPPDDEVLLRLLPNAYQDGVDAAEFRRYTESTLRDKKRAHAMSIRMLLLSAIDGDVVLDFDLMCHLSDYESHLKSVCSSTNNLVLETAVCDSDDPYKNVLIEENKNIYDMSGNGQGCRPSVAT